ncbi:MAG: carboxypeptidase-like regulatory domain-containing protein [Bacteroidales bacterium]|nr:carboxypeptidase-like regulatory domain-containing protein [Bacteroidales bacterium]
MRHIIYILLFVFINTSAQQTEKFSGKVVDKETKQPLAFCNIRISGTNTGTITNEQGVFVLHYYNPSDIIEFSYIGYKQKRLNVNTILQKSQIELEKEISTLNEFSVVADDDFLYEIVTKCRRTILSNRAQLQSKVYYRVESYSSKTPIELLECYYNAQLDGLTTNDLIYKNGRTAQAPSDGNYFNTYNTSQALTQLNLANDNGYFPKLPTQLPKRKMRTFFKLFLANQNQESFCIEYSPIVNDGTYFSGKLWIQKKTWQLLKIEMEVSLTKTHPFLPQHQTDRVFDVSIKIIQQFTTYGEVSVPDYTSFQYQLKYHSVRDSNMSIPQELSRIVTRSISSKGIIEYYDYGKPFLIPFFDYPSNLYYGDYYKMTFIPYDSIFWAYNTQMLLTSNHLHNIDLIKKNGKLINHNPTHAPGYENKSRFEFHYSFWSPDKRVFLKRDIMQFEPYNDKIINQSIRSELYQIKVQILLNASNISDSIICQTYTVFDTYNSFFHLPHDLHIYGILNIYFDLCEIERRRLDSIIATEKPSFTEISRLHQISTQKIEQLGEQFFKEVKLGENRKALEKWNKIVFTQIGIDNLALVEATIKYQENR